jgi:N-methylhydantoinase B
VHDPIANEIFRHLFTSVAEEMGVTLERTAFSPNIKERRDHSCALFDREGRLVAQAAHIPVHLGAFPLLMDHLVPRMRWSPGDAVICNDPFVGGTHLPDLSVVTPVFDGDGALALFVANRAHHADVGGATPGSMGPATEVFQEGMIVPPLKLVDAGRLNEAVLELFCRNVRTPDERRGDLAAQLAANETGARRVRELLETHGVAEVQARIAAARAQSERATRELLAALPPGEYRFEDWLDDDGQGARDLPIRLAVTIGGGRVRFDFTGTAPQSRGAVNAPLAVTRSAVTYAILCLLPEEVPFNDGCFAPIEVEAPPGCLVNARPPAAVAGGNVETSQRIVDAAFGALAQALPERIPAASQGTMNNLLIGGLGPDGEPFAYYETIGGGAGAGPTADGVGGIHCHMSNTRNTPAEALEYHYPLRVREYRLLPASGGAGLHRGGAGLRREIELLADARVTLLTERRSRGPYGLAGGSPGRPGRNRLTLPGPHDARPRALPAKTTFDAPAGAVIRIESPGGGGWGPAGEITVDTREHEGAQR